MAPRQKRSAGNEESDLKKKKPRLSKTISMHISDNHEDANADDEGSDSQDAKDSTTLEPDEWKSMEGNVIQAGKLIKANDSNAIRMKNGLNSRRESLLRTITQHKTKINTGRNMFENSIWPVLTSALVPVLTTDPTILNSNPIHISQTMSKENRLFQDCDKVLSEARRLDDLLKLDNINEPPPSRIPEFKASIEVEKQKALQLIRAGKKTATCDIQRRLAMQDLRDVDRHIISDEDKEMGKLLMNWGSNDTDVAVVHNSALGNMATSLIKAVAHIEKLFKHDVTR